MWLITNKGFGSVVEDRNDAEQLIVRARQSGLLEEMLEVAGLKDVHVWVDETADYPHRCKLKRGDFASLMQAQAQRINYDNFKASVKDQKLASLYHEVWGILSRLGMGKHYGHSKRSESDRDELG